jgi:hypothetical protein
MGITKCQRDNFATVTAELEFGAVRSAKGEVRRESRGIENACPQFGGGRRRRDGDGKKEEREKRQDIAIHLLPLIQSVIWTGLIFLTKLSST